MIQFVVFIALLNICAFASDVRTLDGLGKTKLPDDTVFVEENAPKPACDTNAIISGRLPVIKSSAGHVVFESGILLKPTTFSYDFVSDTKYFRSYSHPSFFVSPGIKLSLLGRKTALSFAMIYQGLYDFYFDSEQSGPVISRLQNPEFSVQLSRLASRKYLKGYDYSVAIAHESNGMFIESDSQYNAIKKSFPEGYIVQDFASMGWNYLSQAATFHFKFGSWKFDTFFLLKEYMNQTELRFSGLEDSSIFYSDGEKPHIWQYDGSQFELTTIVPTDFFLLKYIHLPNLPWTYGSIGLGIQSGGVQCGNLEDMFANQSYHATFKGRWWHLPILGFVTVERGYAQPIAYYSLRTWKTRIGFEFNNFRFDSGHRKNDDS
ncbi:MAG: hypothetical protein JF616_12835 [Fibrobacteres bacterium]|nr:hypothetical protein [Fibrobacterota bacterium]